MGKMTFKCMNKDCNWEGPMKELNSNIGGDDDPARCPECLGFSFRTSFDG